MVNIVDQNSPPSSLPSTTISSSNCDNITSTVNTLASGPMRDDTSITSSGCGSLTKKKQMDGLLMEPSSLLSSIVTDSGISESSEFVNALSDSQTSVSTYLSAMQVNVNGGTNTQPTILSTHTTANAVTNNAEQGHSRNSSNTSQVSGNWIFDLSLEWGLE